MWKGKTKRQRERERRRRMNLIKTKVEEPKFEMIWSNVRLHSAVLILIFMNNQRM
jgi:hypothetical protein